MCAIHTSHRFRKRAFAPLDTARSRMSQHGKTLSATGRQLARRRSPRTVVVRTGTHKQGHPHRTRNTFASCSFATIVRYPLVLPVTQKLTPSVRARQYLINRSAITPNETYCSYQQQPSAPPVNVPRISKKKWLLKASAPPQPAFVSIFV